jgi:Ran GTPase-activating protein 1
MDLIAPYLRKKIDSFENEPAIEAFRDAVKKTAEVGMAVHTFSLMGNSYGAQFFKELSPFVEKFPSIQKLVINDIFTQRDHDVVESLKLITAMFMNKNIVALDMSNNAIAPTGCQVICDLIRNSDKLQFFWANNCGLAQNGVIHIAKAIAEGKSPLRLISMTRNRIEVKAAEVGQALARVDTLEELIMFQNGIKEEGMVGLLEGLDKCKNLRKLDLSDNWFLGKSLDMLCHIIEHCPKLVEINVGDCNLSSADNKKILAAFKKVERPWKGFGYNYNELNHEKTVKEFFEALTKHKTLEWIQLKGNEVEEDLIEYFNDQIKDLPHKVNSEFESEEEDDDHEEAFDHDFTQVLDGMKKLHI